MASTQIDRLGFPVALTALLGETAGVYTNQQMNQPYAFLLGGINPLVEYQSEQTSANYSTDALVGGNAVPGTSTVYGANAIAAYASSASPATNTVAVYGQFRTLANGVRGWGANFVTDDGGFAANLQAIEIDLGVRNSGTQSSGISVNGVFSVAPAAAYAFVAVAAPHPFTWAYSSENGAATIGLNLGSLTAAGISASQPISMYSRDSTGAQYAGVIQVLSHPGGASLYLAAAGANANIQCANPLSLAYFTVATLPAAASNPFCVAFVTDAASPTYHGTLTGGGTVGCPVFSDGAVWRS